MSTTIKKSEMYSTILSNYKQSQQNQSMPEKPCYSDDTEKGCGIVYYGSRMYLIDSDHKNEIINSRKRFAFQNETDIYPSYNHCGKKINYLEFLYKVNTNSNEIIFKNQNQYDLRRENIIIHPLSYKSIIEHYNVIEYLGGHYNTMGSNAGITKNPIWKILDDSGEELYIMSCEPNVICTFCKVSLSKIREFEEQHTNGNQITWHATTSGYIQGKINANKTLYVHQVIMNCFGNGKGTNTISVDHIDRDKLNNRFNNLRLATLKEQQQNTSGILPGTLRQRSSKLELPAGLTYEMLKKYVYYNKENYGTSGVREFFRVEHPKLEKCWSTTKSMKVNIIEKLHAANKVSEDLDNDIYPVKINPKIVITENTIISSEIIEENKKEENNIEDAESIISSITESSTNSTNPQVEIILPRYVFITNSRGKKNIMFERRTKDFRISIRQVLPSNYNLQTELENLNKKIIEKYGTQHSII